MRRTCWPRSVAASASRSWPAPAIPRRGYGLADLPVSRPGAFSGEVEIDVPNAGTLVPGMFVTVDIHYGESAAATLVPTSAIYENAVTGETGVSSYPTRPTR